MSVETLLSILRGPRVVSYLVEGSTRLVDPSLYPFKTVEVPLQCIDAEGNLPSFEAYTSGNRSIVQPSVGGGWFKAKAVGIPSGDSKPVHIDGRIYTYHLFDTYIGTGRLIWGLSTVEEAENEISNVVEARELGLPGPKPIGLGSYENVHVVDLKDRVELFGMLQSTPRDALLRRFKESSRPVKAACIFTSQPTDVRVDEILYGFLHPCLPQILDARDCKDFLRWLGSSCGLNLRMHHDADLLHGTIPKHGGFMTNSHTANHLVDERGTYTTDYHMAYKSKDKNLKRTELLFLASVMNPLPRAEEAARKAFEDYKPLPLELLLEGNHLRMSNYWGSRTFKPESPQEEFTEAFLDGIEHGYNKQRVMHMETKLRREIMSRAAAMKKALFQLLGLPTGMQRGVEYVMPLLRTHRFTDKELKASYERIKNL
ncbi:MAG: hypothetical protein AOA65_2276 [Candidatus Bathyarchaeota archaeon BA1]|nr:MAG: hypothetical protein AOA65_2276 [Candidatus Bathyarchaeota archaeon BA1]